MQQFGFPLQQKSIHLRMSEVEALIRVIVAAKGYATGDVIYHELLGDLPSDESNGRLIFEIKRRPISAKLGVLFSFKISCIFSEIKLGSDGVQFCEILLRQDAWVERIHADAGQVQALGKVGKDYEAAFRKEGFEGITQSWDLIASYARSYRMSRLDATRITEMNSLFAQSRELTARFTEFRNLVNPGIDGSSNFKFKTLIDGELENRNAIFEVKPSKSDPLEFLLYKKDGRRMMVDADHQMHPLGKYNYVVYAGSIMVGKGVGHYWLSNGGKQVSGAGSVTFKQVNVSGNLKSGVVVHWDNDSGHFRPHPGVALYQGPFPAHLFEAVHIREMLIWNKRAVVPQAPLVNPLEVAIDQAFRNPARGPDARQAIIEIAKALNLSNRVVKDKMFSMNVIASMKTSKWDEDYEPTH
ncbi:hypothetical protein [Paraburkholderia hospita]|uniref:hypothetical protein n=1 Tax=Paraburkholderia hospita TaxID=169430 RepID=UPI000B341F25|nr:hypothetical protein [Paraburkholderia hospita]OUL70297.1 hypothetical protein CA603_49250 [Paraburkholderia hospita]